MTVPVTYECPYCGTVQEVERDPYLDDKSVTRTPLGEWEYTTPSPIADYRDADGIAFACATDDDSGCGRTFFLNFVKFEDGREVDPW